MNAGGPDKLGSVRQAPRGGLPVERWHRQPPVRIGKAHALHTVFAIAVSDGEADAQAPLSGIRQAGDPGRAEGSLGRMPRGEYRQPGDALKKSGASWRCSRQ